ncbi:MAG: hypothetical protein BWK78_04030 [Thiotrichaceae bacterium IS1]|nr:MAG: hypothetical protein BWK78_04030 [Thiotrichaceae bacterium IS1]
MNTLVYIETTIPSFYYEIRTEPDMIARRDWTRQWWNSRRHHYTLVTSGAVLEELNCGNYPNQDKAIALLEEVTLLSTTSLIIEIVNTYINHRLMPKNPTGDALHLALASYHRCDFLLTWNCQNLANANKFRHIEHINKGLGLAVPLLVTPVQLLEGDDNDK